jgi:hypothetical protein
MKRLGSLDICGMPFEVILGTRQEFTNLDDAYGYTDRVDCKIVLRDGMGSELFRNVLIHELQHAIWGHCGLQEIGAKTWENLSEYEEAHIQIFTPHLIAALASMKRLKIK